MLKTIFIFLVSFVFLCSKSPEFSIDDMPPLEDLNKKIKQEFGDLVDPNIQINELKKSQIQFISNDLINYFKEIKAEILANKNVQTNIETTILKFLYLVTEASRLKYLLSTDLSFLDWKEYKKNFDNIRNCIMEIENKYSLSEEEKAKYSASKQSTDFDKLIKGITSIRVFANYELAIKLIKENHELPGLPNKSFLKQ